MTLKTAALGVLSFALLLTGSIVLYNDLKPDDSLKFHTQRLDQVDMSKLMTQYPVTNLIQYAISRGNHELFHLTVARYQDETGNNRQAIVFPADANDKSPILNAENLRYQVWHQAALSIKEHVDQNAVFFTWWDNAQRLHLLTGRSGWANAPNLKAYRQKDEQALWREIGGTFDQNPNKLAQLADWLMMDAEQGLKHIRKELSSNQTAYFLISLDDLSRLQELSILIDRPIPIESRVFRTSDNIHTLIAQVKSWSKTGGGNGKYLVQPLPGIGVRAWRITDLTAENLLLVRLLPFTHAIEVPLENITMVYRSEWGGYLSIFRLDA